MAGCGTYSSVDAFEHGALDRLEVAQQRAEQYGMREEDIRQHCLTEEVLRDFLREISMEQNHMQVADVESRAFVRIASATLQC